MKPFWPGVAVVLGVLACFAGSAAAEGFALSSSQLKEGSVIGNEQEYKGFGCEGKNISPDLRWSGAPANAKSFALTVYDPDAPTGSGFWHWVVFNIPVTTTSLPKNAGDVKAGLMPAGAVQSRTDFGVPGWGGPCSPKGDGLHRYVFTVFAVDVDRLDLNADTPAAIVGFMLHFHTVDKAKFTSIFWR